MDEKVKDDDEEDDTQITVATTDDEGKASVVGVGDICETSKPMVNGNTSLSPPSPDFGSKMQ